jgi:hypothetical protein
MTRKQGKTGRANGRRRTPAPTRARRTQTIKFLTLDETRRLFEWVTDKRDEAMIYTALVAGSRGAKARQHFLKLPKF